MQWFWHGVDDGDCDSMSTSGLMLVEMPLSLVRPCPTTLRVPSTDEHPVPSTPESAHAAWG